MLGYSKTYEPGPRTEEPIVLVVDDEVLIRLLIADELRARGFNVIEAANSNEALAVLRSAVPVCLLFTDIRMPGPVDGIGLAGLARAEHPDLKVIVASGQTMTSVPKSADAFLRKPYDIDAVVQQVDRLLADVQK
jgi:two-component system, response regulator PdtaR